MRYRRRSRVLSIALGVVMVGVTPPLAQTRQDAAPRGLAPPGEAPATPAPAIAADQMQRLGRRIETVTGLLQRFESDAKARGLASGWRQATVETLLRLPLDHLDRVDREIFTLEALAGAVPAPNRHARAALPSDADPHLLGDRSRDLVYTPTVPCRFIDTRTLGGKIDGVRAFSFDLSGATYGGSASCGNQFANAPAKDIGALAMNVTLVDTSAGAPGFVAVKPLPQSPTVSLVNWYERGPDVQAANLAIVTLAQPSQPGVDFVVQTSGPVHIVVDIFGAFVTPFATTLDTEHVIQSQVVPASPGDGGAQATCSPGYRLTGGGCYSDQYGMLLSTSGVTTDQHVFCTVRNTSGIDVVLFARAICARIPGR